MQLAGHAQSLQELEARTHTSEAVQQPKAQQQDSHAISMGAPDGGQFQQAITVRGARKRAADASVDDPELCRPQKSQKRQLVEIKVTAHSTSDSATAAQAQDGTVHDVMPPCACATANLASACLRRNARRRKQWSLIICRGIATDCAAAAVCLSSYLLLAILRCSQPGLPRQRQD